MIVMNEAHKEELIAVVSEGPGYIQEIRLK